MKARRALQCVTFSTFCTSDFSNFCMPFLEAHGIVKSYPVGGRAADRAARTSISTVEARRDGGDRRRIRGREEHAAARARRTRSRRSGHRRDRRRPISPRCADRRGRRIPQSAASASCFSSTTCCRSSARSRTPRCRCASRATPMTRGARARDRRCCERVGLGERLASSAGDAVGRRAAARGRGARAGHAAGGACWPTRPTGDLDEADGRLAARAAPRHAPGATA